MATDMSPSAAAEQCLEEGKKHLAAGDPLEAVECFQDACGVLASKHGQLASELAEPYYLYGKALLELARAQSSVLGCGVPAPAENEDSSDEEEESVEEESPETEQPIQTVSEAASSRGDAPGSSTANETNGDAPGSSTANETNGDAPGSGVEGEEDDSDLKLAWEILELARVICQKQNGEEYKLKLSDVQLVLAEVSLEADQSEQAIADLNSSLQIRELFLETHDRRLAEVHFNLGLAHVLSQQPVPAMKHFSSARDVLVERREMLNTKLGGPDLDEKESTFIKEEVTEIDLLLPDIQTKITDTQEMKKLMEQREFQTEECGFPAASSSSSFDAPATTLTTAPVANGSKQAATDISHLVRKRVSDTGDGGAVKKGRTEETTLGEVSAEQ